MNQKSAIVIAFSPLILLIVYPFIVSLFMSDVFMYTAYLFIPIVAGNIVFVLNTSSKGYDIKLEEDRKRMEEEQRILDEAIERLWKEKIRKQREQEREAQRRYEEAYREYQRRATALQKDKNKENAIKLMGLSNDPTVREVKSAYKKLSKIHHPDVGGTHENFIRLNKAYEYLIKVL